MFRIKFVLRIIGESTNVLYVATVVSLVITTKSKDKFADRISLVTDFIFLSARKHWNKSYYFLEGHLSQSFKTLHHSNLESSLE